MTQEQINRMTPEEIAQRITDLNDKIELYFESPAPLDYWERQDMKKTREEIKMLEKLNQTSKTN